MSEEFNVKEHEHKHHHHDENDCFCKSKGFRKFLIVALGTFVGAFCALSLFCALRKPPVMAPFGYPHPMMGYHHDMGCPCHKKMADKKDFKFHKDFKGEMNKDKMPMEKKN